MSLVTTAFLAFLMVKVYIRGIDPNHGTGFHLPLPYVSLTGIPLAVTD